MILVLDNYDSFVQNLARYLRRLGHETTVVRSDAISVSQVADLNPTAIVMSPGPCTPAEAGCCVEVVRTLHQRIPMLGVCLGHQAIAVALGGQLYRSAPVHGRASDIRHNGCGCFQGLPNPMAVGRYHSLSVDLETVPECFDVDAQTDDGTIMALRHREYPVCGLQFHPESILTTHGYEMLAAFLNLAGLPATETNLSQTDEFAPRPAPSPLPDRPVTF